MGVIKFNKYKSEVLYLGLRHRQRKFRMEKSAAHVEDVSACVAIQPQCPDKEQGKSQ